MTIHRHTYRPVTLDWFMSTQRHFESLPVGDREALVTMFHDGPWFDGLDPATLKRLLAFFDDNGLGDDPLAEALRDEVDPDHWVADRFLAALDLFRRTGYEFDVETDIYDPETFRAALLVGGFPSDFDFERYRNDMCRAQRILNAVRLDPTTNTM